MTIRASGGHGKARPEAAACIRDAVARIVRTVTPRLAQFGIRITLDDRLGPTTDRLARWVPTTPTRLGEVVVSLVTHTQRAISTCYDQGSIRLQVEPDGEGSVRLRVVGTGQNWIVHRSSPPVRSGETQPDRSTTAPRFLEDSVEALGGTIVIADHPPGRAELVVTLPAGRQPAAAGEPHAVGASATAPRPQPSERRLLFVDDEPGIRRSVPRFLSRFGWRVLAVASATEALGLLETESFDAIVSDLRMPGLSGQEFYRNLCDRHPEHSHRVAFITGDTLSDDTHAFLEHCACPVLAKPYDLPALVRLAEQCCRRGTAATTGTE